MKRRYFFRKFFQYFLVFSLPVLIMGIILSIYSFIRIRRDINQKSESTFLIGSELINEIMSQSDGLAAIFNNSTAVSGSLHKILNQKSLDYKEYIAKDLISSILENSVTNFNNVESIYIYLANNHDMFYQTNKDVQTIRSATDTGWLDSYLQQDPGVTSWVEKRSFSNYEFESEHTAVTLFRRIKYYDGVLVTNLNIQTLSEKLSSIENYPNEAIIVTDSSGQLLFANPNAQSMQFDPDRDILSQLTFGSQKSRGVSGTVHYGGDAYILTDCTLGKLNLHFLSLVPRRDIYQLLYQIIYCVIIGVITAAVFCLLFSLYMTNRSFNQIERLLDIFSNVERGTYQADSTILENKRELDEYNLILNQVIQTFIRNNMLTLQIRESELKKTKSDLMALQLQINPHFFFNTLQSIDMEIIKKEGYQAAASQLIHYLSDILRYALEDSSTPVPLGEEIQACKEYFEIQKFHYPGQISLLWDYDEECKKYSVLRLLFQPLVENSIRYSISGPKDRCIIRIKILNREDCLRIHILDTGSGMDKKTLYNLRASLDREEPGSNSRIGVKNIHRRLILSYPGNPGLSVISIRGQGTCISFSVPKAPENTGKASPTLRPQGNTAEPA